MRVQHHMKMISSLFLLFIGNYAISQSAGTPENTSSGNVSPKVLQKPPIAGSQQYQQLMNNLSDADAWLDYYKWVGNNKEMKAAEKQQALSQTIISSKQYIASSWQYNLMNFIQSGKKNKILLDAVLASTDNKAMLYPYAIQYAIISHNEQLLNEYAGTLNEVAPLSPALYEYHYNALNSAGTNATIYAKGLTDLAPMAILQQVYGIRKDVKFRYYEQKITDTANAYICLSAGKDIIKDYPAAVYSGLLVKVTGNALDKNLIQQPVDFKLTQLNSLQTLNEEEKNIYKNYLPSFILLYRSQKMNNDAAADHWKQLAQKAGRLTGSIETVNKMLAE